MWRLLAIVWLLVMACNPPSATLPPPREPTEDERSAADAHVANAEDYIGERDFGLALTELDQAIAVWPGHPSAWLKRQEIAKEATIAAVVPSTPRPNPAVATADQQWGEFLRYGKE